MTRSHSLTWPLAVAQHAIDASLVIDARARRGNTVDGHHVILGLREGVRYAAAAPASSRRYCYKFVVKLRVASPTIRMRLLNRPSQC